MEKWAFALARAQPFALTGAGAGLDSVQEQEELEARKLFENTARREAAFLSVQCMLCWAAF
jgi:hypothetical protein